MALSGRRQGGKLLSRTLKSLSGVLNEEFVVVESPSASVSANCPASHGAFGKALLRNFWAGSFKPLPELVRQQQPAYSSIIYPPVEAKVGKSAPDFTAPAIVDGDMETISLKDYRGKYVILFFYPKDFTFVCPTEIIAFSDRAKEFEELNCQLIAASCDSEEVHLAWIKTPRAKGGLGHMQIPILADSTKEIAAKYGVLIEEAGIALRGLFIINREGGLEQITVNNAPIGRSVDEAKRLLQAIQFFEEHGEVCPADWQPGSASMKPDAEGSLDYFSTADSSKSESEDFGTKLESITSQKQYDSITSSGKVVLDFYAPWCGKCRMLAPHLEKLQEEHSDIKFVKFDTTADQLQELGSSLGVKALPNIRFLKDGQMAAPEVSGYKKKQVDQSLADLVSA